MLFLAGSPFAGRHAGAILEGTEEGLLAGKARLIVDGGNLLVGIFLQQTLGKFDAIVVDKLTVGAARAIDARASDFFLLLVAYAPPRGPTSSPTASYSQYVAFGLVVRTGRTKTLGEGRHPP